MSYTALEVITATQDDLGDPGFNSTRLLRYINFAQRAIFSTHLFKFCEKTVQGDLTIGEHTYEQQSDHQSTIGGSVTDPTNTDRYFLLGKDSYMTPSEFFDTYPNPENNDQGLPEAWTEFGDQIYFNCPVDKAYTFKQRYYRIPTVITDTATTLSVPDDFREIVDNYVLYRAEKYRGNHDVGATYKQDYEDGLESMVIRYSGNQVTTGKRRDTRVTFYD